MSDIGFVIPTTPQFDFQRTVLSHGWLMLAPFAWDGEEGALGYTYETASHDVLQLRICGAKEGVQVQFSDSAPLSASLEVELRGAVSTMLNIDWDLSAFYAAMRAHEGYEWLETERRGRILIAPSLWEDLAKVLLTTNCSWTQTVNMCRQLCHLGAPHPNIKGYHAFPTPVRIAAMDFAQFAGSVRAGYRCAYLYELAAKIAHGEIDLGAWLRLDGDALFKAVKSLKGFGDYAAGTIARMYERFDHIAIDTACHTMFAERHNGGLKGGVDDIKAHYERFGPVARAGHVDGHHAALWRLSRHGIVATETPKAQRRLPLLEQPAWPDW